MRRYVVTYMRGSWRYRREFPTRDEAYEAFMLAGRDPLNHSVRLAVRRPWQA